MKKWMGPAPKECDLCHCPITKSFIDGRTQMGPWGLMCPTCHKTYGYGLGTGCGQLYDLATLEKIGG